MTKLHRILEAIAVLAFILFACGVDSIVNMIFEGVSK